MSDSDDDIPRLSAATLATLREFYAEQQCDPSEEAAPVDKFSVGAVQEDWRMSQFWYSDETAERLAEELAHEAGKGGRIACLSTPSVYQKLKQQAVDASVVLLEYDSRFSVYDPPYLSQECLSKVALTVKFLSKGKVFLCTGAIMEDDAAKLLGVKVCSFLPKHNRNLANEFRCFVNYPSRLDS
nr:EEF1A lysine methyltransferase 1 isoform X2 [Paramormyrops kingsleyae]